MMFRSIIDSAASGSGSSGGGGGGGGDDDDDDAAWAGDNEMLALDSCRCFSA